MRNLGIHVYGLAAILLGLIGCVWRDFAAVWQPVPAGVPHRAAIAVIAALLFVAAGLAVQFVRTRTPGLCTLFSLHLIAALLWLPTVVGFPRIFGTWSGFAEQFALALAAVIAYASTESLSHPVEQRVSTVARVLFGICVISFGISHFTALPITASMVPTWIPPGQLFWAVATGMAHVLAGCAIIFRINAGLAARLLTVMIVLFGVIIWLPTVVSSVHQHFAWAGNAINLALAGAAWIVADRLAREAQPRQWSQVAASS